MVNPENSLQMDRGILWEDLPGQFLNVSPIRSGMCLFVIQLLSESFFYPFTLQLNVTSLFSSGLWRHVMSGYDMYYWVNTTNGWVKGGSVIRDVCSNWPMIICTFWLRVPLMAARWSYSGFIYKVGGWVDPMAGVKGKHCLRSFTGY